MKNRSLCASTHKPTSAAGATAVHPRETMLERLSRRYMSDMCVNAQTHFAIRSILTLEQDNSPEVGGTYATQSPTQSSLRR